MSEEPSPSSTNGTSGNHSETSSAASPGGPGTRLIVLKHPPSHVFTGEWFDIQIGLEALRGFSPPIPVEADFGVTLHPYGSDEEVDQSIFTIDPPRIHLSTSSTPARRQQAFRCKINASGEDGPAFVIRISPKILINGLRAVTTRRIMMARLKLEVKEKRGWEPVWYKDEGGRDKCMTVVVGLYNINGELETGEKVPLQLKLCYENKDAPVYVSRQEIFRIIGSSRHQIEKKSGTVVLRFRIEDVSKNHQGQEFRVEVAPDPKASGLQDIAPTYTPAVSVRSKRNKRQRSGATKSEIRGPITEARGPSPLSGRPPPPFRRGAAYSSGDEQESLEGADIPRLREAMKGLINWTDDVVNGLYPLQWYVIGYAQHADGTPDYNRPYHSMPNPNATISRILSSYSQSTREHLRVLLSAIDKSSPGSAAQLPGEPFTPSGMPDDRFASLEGPAQPLLPPVMDARMPPSQVPFGQGMASFQSLPSEGPRDKRESDIDFGGQSMYPQSTISQQHESRLLGTNIRQVKSTGLERGLTEVHETQRSRRSFDEESRESEVEYVLARQFKALRTGERLGFPAYSVNKELLGFFRESNVNAGVSQFVPISRHAEDFGPMEILQAKEILEGEMARKSGAFHALKDFGSLASLIDHALVYDWTKDMQEGSSSQS